MPVQTTAQRQIVDLVLTEMLRERFSAAGALVSQFILPPVYVPSKRGVIPTFDDDYELLVGSRRTPGGPVLTTTSSYGVDRFELYQDAIAETITEEELEDAGLVLPGVNMEAECMATAGRRIAVRQEFDRFALIGTPANYPAGNAVALSAGTQFSDASQNPVRVLLQLCQRILDGCGYWPNLIVLDTRSALAAFENPNTVQRFAGVSSDRAITLERFLPLLSIPYGAIVSGKYKSTSAGPRTSYFGNSIGLYYVDPLAWGSGPPIVSLSSVLPPVSAVPVEGASAKRLSFGYTYTLEGYPMAMPSEHTGATATEGALSWRYPVRNFSQPVISCAAAGALITNVAA